MPFRPKGRAFLAFVYLRGRARLDRFEIYQYPLPGRDVFEIFPLLGKNNIALVNEFANNIFGMPPREND